MDNIFEIIVFFFVIYSILSSVFGKKKPPQKKEHSQYKQTVPQKRTSDTKSPTQNTQSSQDILEDLFGFKIPRQEEESSYSSTKTNQNLDYQSWDPEKDFKQKVEQKEKYEYRNIEKQVPDVNYDKIPTLESTQKKIKSAETKSNKQPISEKTIELKKKLKDPTTLRDFVLISEILGKPKALRKIR